METQQSYKFLTDLGLAQYDATVRQYMEQTFAKKGETPSGSGVNVVEATLELGEKEEDLKISEMSHTPDQIWDMLQTKQAVVIQGTLPEEGTFIFFPAAFKDYTQGVPAVPKGVQKRMIFCIFPDDGFVGVVFEEYRDDKNDLSEWVSQITVEEIGNPTPLSVAVQLNDDRQFASADYYLDDIWKAIRQNRPVFMHVYSPSPYDILFLQLSKINNNVALFSGFFGGEYYECQIAKEDKDCWFTKQNIITDI